LKVGKKGSRRKKERDLSSTGSRKNKAIVVEYPHQQRQGKGGALGVQRPKKKRKGGDDMGRGKAFGALKGPTSRTWVEQQGK